MRPLRCAGWLLLGVLGACRREPAPDRSGPPPVASSPPGTVSAASRAAVPEAAFRWPATERVVAVGDLHGDLAATRRALRLAGAVDAQDRWIGGKLVLVQTGDLLDRGDDERQVVELFDRIAAEASAQGGAVYQLVGNHEVMNVEGDFRYVSPRGLLAFGELEAEAPTPLLTRVPARMRARAAAFLPGRGQARRLGQHPAVAIVANTLFAHGGILAEHASYGLGRLNGAVDAWLRGELADLPDGLRGERAPYWTRRYSDPTPPEPVCRELGEVLHSVNAERLVVGHTVQENGVTSACDGQLWRIDVGLSAHYGSHATEVLELRPTAVKVLSEQR